MLSFKAFRLNQKINTGGAGKNCGTSNFMGEGRKGNEENQVQSKNHKEVTARKVKYVVKT